jgi:hypothetical protein
LTFPYKPSPKKGEVGSAEKPVSLDSDDEGDKEDAKGEEKEAPAVPVAEKAEEGTAYLSSVRRSSPSLQCSVQIEPFNQVVQTFKTTQVQRICVDQSIAEGLSVNPIAVSCLVGKLFLSLTPVFSD